MEKTIKKRQEPKENPNFTPDGKFKIGNEVGKLGGRPNGSLDFKTKWRIFVEKVAKQNNMTPNEIDEQLLAVGFKKAKEGDYSFYRDIHDRVYGKPVNPVDVTSKGEQINQVNNVRILELTNKLNDLHRGGSITSNGVVANTMDSKA